jgi:hypothetical protein
MGSEFSSINELKNSQKISDLIHKSIEIIYESQKVFHDSQKIETDKTMKASNVGSNVVSTNWDITVSKNSNLNISQKNIINSQIYTSSVVDLSNKVLNSRSVNSLFLCAKLQNENTVSSIFRSNKWIILNPSL